MRRFDLLIFDLGSTLIYFDADWPEVFSQANAALVRHLRGAGLDLPEEVFLQAFRSRMDGYFAERDAEFVEYTTAYILRTMLGEFGHPEVPETLVGAALKSMYAVSQSHWQPETDAIPTLAILREAGYRLAIISNAADDADVQALVDKAGIRPYFEVILTSAAAGIRKPNPRIFHMVLEELEAAPGRAAMIGDMLGADVLGAQNAGLFSVWITRRADVAANRAHADTLRPDVVIQALDELPALLESMNV